MSSKKRIAAEISASEVPSEQPDALASASSKERRLSDPQELKAPDGLRFIAKFNKKSRCFFMSTKNYFGIYKVSKVMYDCGCTSLLIPLAQSEDLQEIVQEYGNQVTFKVGKSSGCSGKSLTLTLEKVEKSEKFEIKLCTDILPNSSPLQSKLLRFALCQEDIQYILSNEQLLAKLDLINEHIERLKTYANLKLERLETCLLGRLPTKGVTTVILGDDVWFVSSTRFDSAFFKKLQRTIDQVVPSKPDGFADWQDDFEDIDESELDTASSDENEEASDDE